MLALYDHFTVILRKKHLVFWGRSSRLTHRNWTAFQRTISAHRALCGLTQTAEGSDASPEPNLRERPVFITKPHQKTPADPQELKSEKSTEV
ncbi:hypothetical protein SRHO_G00321900 [Serrasalmus rhombeus]